MNESARAPARPPVPRWERVAAGVLAVVWVGYMMDMGISPGQWWEAVRSGLASVQQGWQSIVAQPTGDLTALLSSHTVLDGISGGLVFGTYCGMPVLIALGASLIWRHRIRCCLWWLALGHGAMGWLYIAVQGRTYSVVEEFNAQGTFRLVWHRGWLFMFEGIGWQSEARFYWAFHVEILLAALVLGLGWWLRRREGEAPAEPK